MLAEAASAGVYTYKSHRDDDIVIRKVQIITIEKLMAGGNPRQPNGVQLPPFSEFDRTVKKAAKADTRTLFGKH